ncbi:hypothetical protein AOLI_G00098540 [Acnodon oligacanthus]
MTVKKARLEASLDTLRLEKKAATALAKAEASEVAAEQENEDVLSKVELLSDDRKERTKEYVQGHNIHGSSITMPVLEGPFFNGVHLAGSVPQYEPTITIQHQTDEQGNEYEEAEVIESSLFKRLENVPKISNKDKRRLRELGDLLLELQAAKADGDLLGLTYLDTPRGINPVVHKLPFYLQEKWLSLGSKYKEEHNVSYPPFSYLVEFVSHQTKIRNDPSSSLQTVQEELLGQSKRTYKQDHRRIVAVHKTEIPSNSTPAESKSKKKADPAKHCLLHNKPHPLPKCRGFREKPIEERKAFLKLQGIDYKCCRSLVHMAKNCDDVKCVERGSDTHVSALHPGPAPWSSKSESPEHGGEETDSAVESAVSSAWTKICGKCISGCSCSNICLVIVYPVGNPGKAV